MNKFQSWKHNLATKIYNLGKHKVVILVNGNYFEQLTEMKEDEYAEFISPTMKLITYDGKLAKGVNDNEILKNEVAKEIFEELNDLLIYYYEGLYTKEQTFEKYLKLEKKYTGKNRI